MIFKDNKEIKEIKELLLNLLIFFRPFLPYQITTRSSSGMNIAPSVMPKAS